jgi:hypothetical protein
MVFGNNDASERRANYSTRAVLLVGVLGVLLDIAGTDEGAKV